MSISIQNAEKMFSEDIVLNHFINLCIQKGFINKKFKYKILKDINKKTDSEKQRPKNSPQRHLIVKDDCEYEVNIPIIPDYSIINIDGIDYYQNIKSGMIIDTKDFGELGTWNQGEGAIDFISEDHRNFHSLKL
tara:strand:+ start:87 stop:488 length:402 start_codon:yes stop_codon:yes gene_type:complete